jgi:hypothetical protein
MNFERRAIDELVALYELEPAIRDVYVEGDLDEALVQWFLLEAQVPIASVTEIGAVDVPSALVKSRGLDNNNRGRLTALAEIMEEQFGGDFVSLTCIVDADFDRILGEENGCRLLLMTDYACMEMYLFDVQHLTKFLHVVIRKFPRTADDVRAAIQQPLTDLFAIRLADRVLRWGIPIVAFEGCCEITQTGVRLDVAEYVDRCLNAGQRHSDKEEFEQTRLKYLEKLKGDVRNFVHGHDLLNLLGWYLRKHKGHKLSRETVDRSFFACAESASLGKEVMFQRLLDRVTSL